jgi:predicted permease
MNDLKFALRSLRRSPGFTFVSILTLAVGIGLNTSMFSFVSFLLLQPIPYPDKNHLVRVYRTTPQSQKLDHSARDYLDLKGQCGGFLDLSAYRFWQYTLKQPDHPAVTLTALRVSASFFPLLGVRPELGRSFSAEEDAPGNSVIMISHATWQAQFGGDPAVVGRTVHIDGQPTVIIGVMPASFSSVAIWGPGDAFRPLGFTDLEKLQLSDRQIQIVGRYHPGMSLGQLNARLAAMAGRLSRDRPRENSRDGLRAAQLQADFLNPSGGQMVWLLLGLSGTVLLIVCGNLANLQLSRAMARSQEFAICSALGASRSRLLRPLLSESLLLSLAGGALGILVAVWSNDWMSARMSANGLLSVSLPLDWKVLGFTLAISLATGVAFGIVPAVLMSRVSVNSGLKSGGRGSTGDRAQHFFRNALIVGQFALALTLLAAAGSFIQGINGSVARNLGWNAGRLLQCVINLPQARYSTPAKTYSFYTRLQDRLAVVPGVEQVAVGWSVPIFQFLTSRTCTVEGRPLLSAGHEPSAYVNGVTPTYLDALDIRLVSGRNFTDADRSSSTPVAIIDESMARALFPNESPLGHRMTGLKVDGHGWVEIVGVIPDQQFAVAMGAPATPFQVFIPLAQETWNYVTVVVKAQHPENFADSLRRAVEDQDPDIPVQQLGTVAQLISSFSGLGMITTILVSFAVLGLFLSAIGLYGVIARLVVLRTPEIGVRLALGAQPWDAVWLVLGMGVRLMAAGTVLGLLGSYLFSRVLAHIMPSATATHGGSVLLLLGVTSVLFAVALLACWLPARRAARVDPLVALRAE